MPIAWAAKMHDVAAELCTILFPRFCVYTCNVLMFSLHFFYIYIYTRQKIGPLLWFQLTLSLSIYIYVFKMHISVATLPIQEPLSI